ncbi:MAG: DNA helicase RecQ [Gammaproteobacteria bacterium]|nr:DNA helicase RecQ [Gammaproteobacteria bacterium]
MGDKKLKQLLKQTFGHSDFRFDQLDIIKAVIHGKDALAIMPTGGGKSICYQLPALYNKGITLVVSPLISLMNDQVVNLNEYGIPACFLNSMQDINQRQEAEDSILSGEVKLVYVSPEGLLSGYLLNFFRELEISLIAIDEAHCVSQWGHEFRRDYTRLGELKNVFVDTPFLALTATADARTRVDIIHQLHLEKPEQFISSFDRPNIKYSIYERYNEITQLQDFISTHHKNDTGIVYCLSRRKVEKVASELAMLGHRAVPYHAGLPKQDRQQAQDIFNREDNVIIVATIAFGMGIDRPDVRFVAHMDLPKSIESYYQETGRAGRDGRPSNAWMIYGLQDVIKLSKMLETTEASEAYKKVARYKLNAMLSLCETTLCRRQYLLNYFEEDAAEKCDHCDTCLEPGETWDATEDAQKILSTIYRTGQIFGAGHIVDVLRGSRNAKILERHHNELSVYGLGKDKSKNHWNIVLRQLLNRQYIAITNWDYGNLALTEKSREILKNIKPFTMRKYSTSTSSSSKRKAKTINASHGRDQLFEELRDLRFFLATEKNVPPFVIFSDKSLHDMCHLMPRTTDEFLMVNGVGESKCENYSKDFLKVIEAHTV